jgi:hypothetical protein
MEEPYDSVASANARLEKLRVGGLIDHVELLGSGDERACAAARNREGKRIPLRDACALPLPGCQAATCLCMWVAVR